MYRLRFIVGLILLAVSLLFTAKVFRGVLTMIQPQQAQIATAPSYRHQTEKNLFRTMWAKLSAKKQHTIQKDTPQAASLSYPRHLTQSPDKEPPFFQLIKEDPAVTLKNPQLSETENILLTQFLAEQRETNAQLATDVEALFPPVAFGQTVRTLTKAENLSYRNAQTCTSIQQFSNRQNEIDQQTDKQLTHIFEQYKKSFNYKSKIGPSDWKNFYQGVNNFRKAQNQ